MGKKDHKKKIKNVRSECDSIRSQLKTKNNEASALQKQNAELRLEIDQKNQTIDALQTKVALHATNTTHTNNDRMKKRTDTILLQVETGQILQREVEYFLQSNTDKHCTVLELAEALIINNPCVESFIKKKIRPAILLSTMCRKLKKLPVPSVCSTKKDDEETMKMRYRCSWNNSLDVLVKRPASRDTVLSSWAEAKHYLEDIFVFQTSCPQDYRMSNATANAVVISTSNAKTERRTSTRNRSEESDD